VLRVAVWAMVALFALWVLTTGAGVDTATGRLVRAADALLAVEAAYAVDRLLTTDCGPGSSRKRSIEFE
jgi:hypothetical protein